jgi:hypothetical protein
MATKQHETPALAQLLREMSQLADAGVIVGGGASVQVERFVIDGGLNFGRLTWPGVGDFYLSTTEQQRAVSLLFDAYVNSKNPDVREQTVLRQIGSKAKRLSEVFRDNDAWGRLVIPGRTAGTVRIAAVVTPEEMAARDAKDDERVEPVEDY